MTFTYLKGIQNLRLTLIKLLNGARNLQHPISQRALSVVYVSNYAEVADELGLQFLQLLPCNLLDIRHHSLINTLRRGCF